jgi:hypothetical protein
MEHNANGVDSLYVNGVRVLQQMGDLPVLGGVSGAGTIGKGIQNSYYDGEISEILVYNRALSTNEAAIVENYIIKKYGLLYVSVIGEQGRLKEGLFFVSNIERKVKTSTRASGSYAAHIEKLRYVWRLRGLAVSSVLVRLFTFCRQLSPGDIEEWIAMSRPVEAAQVAVRYVWCDQCES